MPELLERGHIYIAQPPLYKVSQGKKELYLKDDQELQEHLLRLALKDAALTSEHMPEALVGEDLSSLCREYMLVDAAIKRLGRRYYPAVLWSLLSLPPINLDDLDMKAFQKHAKKLQKHLREHHNGVAHYEVAVDGKPGSETGMVFVVKKTLHGTTTECVFDAALFGSNEYQSLCLLGERLQQLGKGPFEVKRGESSDEVSSFSAALDWYMHQARRGLNLQRYKGLGEMNPEQLWETTMDPSKRRLLKVAIEDDVASDDTFTILMGDQVEPRREFIEKNAFAVANLDV